MFPTWHPMLSAAAFGLLAALPVVVVLLYFLKLRRQPIEVPSTYLWAKSIEDLHVNSIWQKLRRNLLLFLQLLLLALVALGLLGLSWRGSQLAGHRLIFLIDNSASMAATDLEGSTRLDAAKREIGKLIDQMRADDTAMLVSFANGARVEQSFTSNRGELRRRLANIPQTDQPTSLAEAVRIAAGLTTTAQNSSDAARTDSGAASLYIASDGGFDDLPDAALGNISPQPLILVGEASIDNVGIMAFSSGKKEGQLDLTQVFARLENFGDAEKSFPIELYRDGKLIDAQETKLPAGKSAGIVFDVADATEGVFELRLDIDDDLAIDNRAWTTLHAPRRSRVLLITSGDAPLEFALGTERAAELADVRVQSEEFLSTAEYRRLAEGGAFDLIIYDRVAPAEMPRANTLFIGELPKDERWKRMDKVTAPGIIDSDRAHPLTQFIDLGDVLVVEATPIIAPAGGRSLIDSTDGSLLAIAPREQYEDAVLGFELVSRGRVGSNWPVRLSFPLFVFNTLAYFGGGRSGTPSSVKIDELVTLRLDQATPEIAVTAPDGSRTALSSLGQGVFEFAGTRRVGVYDVTSAEGTIGAFAVNLFDRRESDLAVTRDRSFNLGQVEVASSNQPLAAERPAWKWLILAAVCVLIFEWYVYNRRVYF